MWAPDIHSIAPLSAFTQLMAAFAGLGLFSGFVYLIQASPPGVSLFFALTLLDPDRISNSRKVLTQPTK
jgi:hypothetical protein